MRYYFVLVCVVTMSKNGKSLLYALFQGAKIMYALFLKRPCMRCGVCVMVKPQNIIKLKRLGKKGYHFAEPG